MMSCETCKSCRSRAPRARRLVIEKESDPALDNLYYERDFLCIVRHAEEADRALADIAE